MKIVVISVLVLIALVSVVLVIHKAFSRNRNRPVGKSVAVEEEIGRTSSPNRLAAHDVDAHGGRD